MSVRLVVAGAAAGLGLLVAACSSDPKVNESSWKWTIVDEPNGFVLANPGNQFALRLEAGTTTLAVVSGDEVARFSANDLLAEAANGPYDAERGAALWRPIFGERPTKMETKGEWWLYRDETRFAFKHASWPIALGAEGSSTGWLVVLERRDAEKRGVILGPELQERLRKWNWVVSDPADAFLISDASGEYAIRLDAESATLAVSFGGGTPVQLSSADIAARADARAYNRRRANRMWRPIFGETGLTIETRGGWQLYRDKEVFSFKHTTWPFALGAGGAEPNALVLLEARDIETRGILFPHRLRQ